LDFHVSWMLAHRESAALAERLIHETCRRQAIVPGQLTVHADRGSSMTSKPVALLLSDLGVTKSHSLPHVSNDNPFSESQFKTMKYRPDFPDRFGAIEHGRAHYSDFFGWYNNEHRHGGLGLLTPHDVHHGLAGARLEARDAASRPPSPPDPNASRLAAPRRARYRARSGSTSQRTLHLQRGPLSKADSKLPHSC
jgi:putative transposase